jgi:hypothetical protein
VACTGRAAGVDGICDRAASDVPSTAVAATATAFLAMGAVTRNDPRDALREPEQ